MKLTKRLMAFFTALTMVITMFIAAAVPSVVSAEGIAPVMKAAASGDTSVEVTLVASEDLEALGSITIDGIDFDDTAFSISDNDVTSVEGLTVTANIAEGMIVVDTLDGAAVSAGSAFLTMNFTKTDGFSTTAEYEFALHAQEIADVEGTVYSWGDNQTYSVKYQEEVPEEYVTFIDTAGNQFKLTTSLIESCEKTANDNYLLSDVLTAVGVDTENLANCRYVAEASDGFKANLDADYFDDIALFYNKRWRTTFDQNTGGYEGGWYKVNYLAKITAENHHYTEGACDNQIDYSRETGDPCGAEDPDYVPEEYVTFIDTAGNEFKLTTSLIESCEKTANDNYLLSDVLTAAGVDTENLANCRYVAEASDGFKANLDADYFDDIALFYNKRWRTTFDQNTGGYEGGWYKVNYLATITAENHHYTEGVCDNQIDYSRETGDPCGAEDPDYVKTGWQTIDGKTYYFDENGEMVTGWRKINNTWYYFDSTGAMKTGWLKVGSTWYYLKSSGAMATGWLKVGSTWYYLKSSGAMATGWLKVGSTWYYLKSSGAMATGWLKVGSTWYYLKSSGAMATGWLKVGSTWYYLYSSGAMATGSVRIGGTVYRFSSSGAWIG